MEEVCAASRDLDPATLQDVIEHLREQGHLMQLPTSEQHPAPRFATRTAELVRSLGTMHEFVARKETEGDDEEHRIHLQMVDAVKWVPEMMSRPRRNKSTDDIIRAVERTMAGHTHVLEGASTTSSALKTLKLVLDGIAQCFDLPDSGSMNFSRFQVDAIARALTSSWLGHHEAQIVAAGTGSGKTITFAVPVLVDALLHGEKESTLAPWSQPLLYPRNDLAFDQYNTLNTYAGKINRLLKERGDSRRISLRLTPMVESSAGSLICPASTTHGILRIGWEPETPLSSPPRADMAERIRPMKRKPSGLPTSLLQAWNRSDGGSLFRQLQAQHAGTSVGLFLMRFI